MNGRVYISTNQIERQAVVDNARYKHMYVRHYFKLHRLTYKQNNKYEFVYI